MWGLPLALSGGLLCGGAESPLHAATYVYIGGNFSDPNSWGEASSGNPGLPGPGDTAEIGVSTPVMPTGLTIGVLSAAAEINVTFSGGSLTIGELQSMNVTLQNSDLTVQNVSGLAGTLGTLPPGRVTVDSGSHLTALAETSGYVNVNGGAFDARATYGGVLTPITSGGQVTINGDALLTEGGLVSGVDGAGGSLTISGTLYFTNGDFVIQNGGTASSGPAVFGPEGGAFPPGDDAAVIGPGSTWAVAGLLQLGVATNGQSGLIVQNGAAVTTQSLDLGVGSQSGALVNLGLSAYGPAQSGGSLTVNGPVRIGITGYGAESVDLDSHFGMSSGSSLELGVEVGSTGSLAIDGAEATADLVSTPIQIGVAGDGTLGVSGTNQFTSGEVQVAVEETAGRNGNGASLMSVNDPGSTWTINGPLTVAVAGNGEADVNTGARLISADEAVIGKENGSTGLADVDGLSRVGNSTLLTEWQADGGLTVGESGQGTLRLDSGGQAVVATGLSVGSETGSTGMVLVVGTYLPGVQTLLDAHNASVTVGEMGKGTLTASVGGRIVTGDAEIGGEPGGQGTVTLQYAGSSMNVAGNLTVGGKGTGTLLVQDQTTLTVSGPDLVVAEESGSHGQATFNGTNAAINFGGQLTIGGAGSGAALVQAGAVLQPESASVAEESGSSGTLTVDGGDARLATLKDLTIGGYGGGKLVITGPATVQVGGGASVAEQLGSRSTATLDAGGVWVVQGDFTVGGKGIAGVSVKNGSQLVALGAATLAETAGSGGTLTLDGKTTNGMPSTMSYADELSIGDQGNGQLVITNGAIALPATNGLGVISVAPQPTAVGSLLVGGPDSILQANKLSVGAGEGQSGGQANVTLGSGGKGWISSEMETGDSGVVDVRDGSLTVGAANPLAPIGTLQINPGGKLAGCGQVKGSVANNGGEVAPGCSPGTLTIQGAYTQASGGALTVRITGGVGGGPSNDVLNVTGNVTLAGRLTLAFLDGFAPKEGEIIQLPASRR